jgi:chemotaxis protein methyltransferase WspC
MNTAAIETWLAAHSGLVADKLGPGQVARVARARIAATGCADATAYVTLLTTASVERRRFIDDIIVPETWFFRDALAFAGLVRYATGPWAAAHPGTTFRALSAPCSSGEEAFTIAMAFLLHGWPAARLQIDGVDISADNIARATEGIYRKNSFRGADLAFREHGFDAQPGDTWRVRDTVRAPVRFAQANLLADDFATGRSLYDAIFCRNLLIYFDGPTQSRAFRALERLLAPDGLLAVGPAEAVLALDHGFSPVPGTSMFLFQKSAAKPAPAPRPKKIVPRRAPAPPVTAVAPARRPAPPPVEVPPLEQLRAHADAGQLAEAAALGDTLLRTEGATAELCHLLAVVADAAGQPRRAEEFFRKAIYLDPQHGPALAHLALLVGKNGDTRAAATLQARARRAETGSASRHAAKEVVA